MAGEDELTALYAEGVEAAMVRAVARRRQGVRWTIPLALLVFAVFYLVFRQAPGLFGRASQFAMILFALVPAVVVWYYAPAWLSRSARRLFAEGVVRPIARSVDAAMAYEPEGRVSREALDSSLLFDSLGEGFTTLAGDNLFRGEAGGRGFEFSALDADKTVQHGCHLFGGTMFSGMFLHIGPKEGQAKKGMLVVAPRSSGLTLEAIHERLDAADRKDLLPLQQVEIVHDPEFDRWFIAIASAGETLSKEARDRLNALRESVPCQPYFSRVDGVAYVGLLTGLSNLEMPQATAGAGKVVRLAIRHYRDDIALMRELAAEPAWW